MKITLKMYASLAPYLPQGAVHNAIAIDVKEDESVFGIIDRYHVPRESAHLVLINGLYVEPADRESPILKEGDVLALWPPVAGG